MDTLFMVAASVRPPRADVPGNVLGIRFCSVDDVAHMEDLLVKQIRRHFPMYAGWKPKQIRNAVTFDVYEIPNPPRRGGYPKWLGPASFYK
jgi:hypothetical protein